MTKGDEIVATARTWHNTPYRHQASLKGYGCDCLGLIRGVWRDLYGRELLSEVPPYRSDWAERMAGEPLLDGLRAHFHEVDPQKARQGNILAFRLKPHASVKHLALLMTEGGILDEKAVILHAYWGHSVVESYLFPFWAKRIAGAFCFP